MPLPAPVPGLVVHHEFLWSDDHKAGETEGDKKRPAVIISATKVGRDTRTIVAPITHSAPRSGDVVIEIPPRVRAHLGLDNKPQWVILNELNEFIWPGYDLYPVPGKPPGTFDYGFIPPALFNLIRDGIIALDDSAKSVVPR